MWPFFSSETDLLRKKIRTMDGAIRGAFLGVKKDTGNLGEWVKYLQEKTERQEAHLRRMAGELQGMHEELKNTPKSPEDIKKIIDQHYSYEAFFSRLKAIEQRLEEVAQKREQHIIREPQIQPQIAQVLPLPELEAIKQKLAQLEQKKSSLKEKIIKRITKNSKDYVKSIILSYIRKYENVSALQLKEMVVDDQGLCSKSSFYRLMEEIEKEHEIGVVKEGKEKHYFVRVAKRNS
jgi:hypothetical protein